MDDPRAGVMLVSQPQTDKPETSVATDTNVWGTWEELLLASAVKRHGTDKWNLVSLEVQARPRTYSIPPSFFTAQACRSKYYAIKRRYCGDDGRDAEVGNSMPWFEELRKLRVAHLKRELEHYDNSIGSLQTKLKRLKVERTQGVPKQVGAATLSLVSDALNAARGKRMQATDVGIRASEGCVLQRFDGRSDVCALDIEAPREHEACLITCRSGGHRVESSGELKEEAHLSYNLSTNNPDDVQEAELGGDKKDLGFIISDDGKSDGFGGEGISDWRQRTAVHDAEVVISSKGRNDNGAVNLATFGPIATKLGGGKDDNTKLVERLTGSSAADVCQPIVQSHKREDDNLHVVKDETKYKTRRGLSSSLDTRFLEDKAVDRQCERVDADGTRVNDHRMSPAKPYFSGDKKSHPIFHKKPQLDSTNTLRLAGTNKERALASLPVGTQSETTHLDGLDLPPSELENTSCRSKMPIQKPVHIRHVSPVARDIPDDLVQSLQLESNQCIQSKAAKERIGAPLFQHDAKEFNQNLSQESGDSTEHGGNTTLVDQKLQIKGGSQSLASRDLTASEPLRFKEWQKSSRSTENLEVSGESMEGVNRKEAVSTTGEGSQSCRKDLESVCKGGSEATDSIKPAEASVRTESLSTSHEESGSMNEGGKEGFYSADSQLEKSEAGSLMDGNEDISPMSRRHRREPKVPGKLLPLLECLRNISAHKCAPMFRHKQETVENNHYDHLIRSHIDLTLIRARLEEGFYSGSVHFFRDLLLMINNALVYFPRESQEFIAANDLREVIKGEMSHIFETEALLKQDRPSTRKHELKRPFNINDTANASNLATLGKQQGGKRGRIPVKEPPPSSDMITKLEDSSKDGATSDGDWVGHETIITDTGKKPRDKVFQKAGKDFTSRILKEGQDEVTGMKIKRRQSPSFVSKPKGMEETGARSLGRQPNRANLVASVSEPKVGSDSLTKVLNNAIKSATTKNVMGKFGQALEVPPLHSQPVKRAIGRPPKHSQHQGKPTKMRKKPPQETATES